MDPMIDWMRKLFPTGRRARVYAAVSSAVTMAYVLLVLVMGCVMRMWMPPAIS